MDHPGDSITAAKACAVPELLENILVHIVDPKQDDEKTQAQEMSALFRLQRVNKTFRDVISGSRALRRAMWLERTYDAERKGNFGGLNPLVTYLFPVIALDFEVRKLRCHIHIKRTRPDFMHRSVLKPKSVKSLDLASWRSALVIDSELTVHLAFVVPAPYTNICAFERTLRKGATLGELEELLVEDIRETEGSHA